MRLPPKPSAFARNVSVRGVMLDGEVSEPSVTMPGGAALSGTGALVRAQELRVAEEQVEDTRKILEALECDKLTDVRRGRCGEPACAKLRSRSISYGYYCRRKLEAAMSRGSVFPHLIFL